METDDLDRILSKSYSELTAAEKETIQDLCSSEEEFIHLQQVFASVENYARETIEDSSPRPETKARLDDLFHETYQNKGILWYNSLWAALYPADKRFDQKPLVRIAAILILFICAVPFFNKSDMEAPQLAVNQEEAVQKVQPETLETVESPVAELKQESSANQAVAGDQQAEDMNISPVLAESASLKDAEYHFTTPANAGYASKYSAESASVGEKSTSTSTSFMGADLFAKPAASRDFLMESARNEDASPAKQNLAMLDLLTPAF